MGEGRSPTVWLFPGQGTEELPKLAALRDDLGFEARVRRIAERLGHDPFEGADRDPSLLFRNEVCSLLTAAASLHFLERLREEEPEPPVAAAGYSVGQWVALQAAGVLDEETLYDVLLRRAQRMSRAAETFPGGMIAVIGVPVAALEAVCSELRSAGNGAWVANENAPNFATLAVDARALAAVRARLESLGAKRIVDLPVAGPWHSPLLAGAARAFRQDLETIPLRPARFPVIDNVTGEELPREGEELREQLADHLEHPVRWLAGIRRAIALGGERFVEIGAGDVLTRYGLFIDRRKTHVAYSPGVAAPERAGIAEGAP